MPPTRSLALKGRRHGLFPATPQTQLVCAPEPREEVQRGPVWGGLGIGFHDTGGVRKALASQFWGADIVARAVGRLPLGKTAAYKLV